MESRFKTPLTGQTSDKDFEHVYEPAEDSFLLLDVLEQEDKIIQDLNCTDLNPKAAEMTMKTAEKNGQTVQPVICHLTSAIEDRLAGRVDVLLFNPPYVVTPSEEVANGGIEASWAGGVRGREVIDVFLPKVSSLLSPAGIFYMVVIEENDPDDIAAFMSPRGFSMTRAGSRRAGREHLSVLKFTRTSTPVT